jgi:hypothetical protein
MLGSNEWRHKDENCPSFSGIRCTRIHYPVDTTQQGSDCEAGRALVTQPNLRLMTSGGLETGK